MKSILNFSVEFTGLLFFLFITVNQVSAQSSQMGNEKGKPIPQNVLKTVEKSCMNCHSENGNFMAESKINLSKWKEYSTEKQAVKAQAMCQKISKGEMPPKKYRKKHPENIPTSDDIKIICEWSQSLQALQKTNLP
jgi:hypothetical protein